MAVPDLSDEPPVSVAEAKALLRKITTRPFCGVVFDLYGLKSAVEICQIAQTGDRFRYVVTPNVDHVVRLKAKPRVYGPLYRAAWLRLCDSRILQLLAWFSGFELPLCAGSDLTALMFEEVVQKTEPVNIIGGDAALIAKIRARYGLEGLNHHEPPMGLRDNPEAIKAAARFIADHPARFTFICVGSPQQEMIARIAHDINGASGLGFCVGASLDFLAGRVKRAPRWMQKLRLEWLFRLLSEPKRMWRRYLVDGPKIFSIWRKWAKAERRAKRAEKRAQKAEARNHTKPDPKTTIRKWL